MFKEEGDFPWKAERFCLIHAMRIDGVDIKAAEAVKLSQTTKRSTAIFCKDMAFVDIMNWLANYNGAFTLKYDLQFVDARTKEIVDDPMSCNYLPTMSKGIYNICLPCKPAH